MTLGLQRQFLRFSIFSVHQIITNISPTNALVHSFHILLLHIIIIITYYYCYIIIIIYFYFYVFLLLHIILIVTYCYYYNILLLHIIIIIIIIIISKMFRPSLVHHQGDISNITEGPKHVTDHNVICNNICKLQTDC